MSNKGEAIAIIGSGCRFPGGANTPSKLWDLLREPHDLLRPLQDRFSTQGWYHEDGKNHGHTNVKEAYLLSGEKTHRQFDAQFFGINAVEASTMDPQMRLLCEVVYEALEAAGQPIDTLRGSNTGVYSGEMVNSYEALAARDLDNIGTYHVSGTSRAMMSNRISYFFDWHGPSMTIDTACSSSLIAVHQAVQLLRSGQSRMAIAAGSNLLLDFADFITMSNLQMLSPDGRSRMWDADANGYARGEGIAVVVLKTLSAAEADGDHIECIIRETGTNQDGATPGITMPNPIAQAELIRDCYARAGLDPTNPAQRPQYFEAHGTGTPAGDPLEAEAIDSAFFGNQKKTMRDVNPLFVGSIKTVVGHTEGTAGLAGLLKASLALQNATVPPNMLFRRLNPKVKPFYSHLEVPTSATAWPSVSGGDPRRASVNSFGFGGANAHAILESYTQDHPTTSKKDELLCMPFVFSAASEASLSSYLESFDKYLQENKATIDLRNIAKTLYSRRTRFSFGTTVAASTAEMLSEILQNKIKTANSDADAERPIGIMPSFQSSEGRKPQILGVFTGQGAQSARMGAELIESSEAARRVIERLEARLARLPKNDRPVWSLKEELLKESSSSKINQAALSQPLCTAVQILQIELVRAAGIEFAAVVGHSSGEIGAAYYAGWISAEDAICIAYYRGIQTDLACDANGELGAMMAVGTSFEDAQSLCESSEFEGRVVVAAINSSSSVTLSGDKMAIEELKLIFEDEHKFARRLKVDKAYHSHHMIPCSKAYLQYVRALNIQVSSNNKCHWFSSVDEGRVVGKKDASKLKSTYWNDNMVNPVKFMQAVKGAWNSEGPFDLAVEVGPHPALKGPTLQTLQEFSNKDIRYTCLFERNKNAVESVADGLGYIWTFLGQNTVDLSGYDAFITGNTQFQLVKGLPEYSWNYEREYWHESRQTKASRTRSEPVHELLGHLSPDATDQEMRWRHFLCPKEVPWLKGHALQHQTVFPAAGYVVAALEACMLMCKYKGASARLVEILDLDIGKALAFNSEDARIETVISLTNIVRHNDNDNDNIIDGHFTYNAAADTQGDTLELLASGRVRVTLGAHSQDVLPRRGFCEPNLLKIETEKFYSSLLELEYQYTGPFRALSRLERKLGFATGYIENGEPSPLLVHPAVLDASIQSLLLVHSPPGTGGIWSLHVPRTIRAVRFNPHLCAEELVKGTPIPFDCTQPADANAMAGDVELFADGSENTILQIEGLHCVPFSRATAHDDKELFTITTWDVASPDARRITYDGEPTEEQFQLAQLLDRIAVYHLRCLERDIPSKHQCRVKGPWTHLFKFAAHIISSARAGNLPLWSSKWQNDSYKQLTAASEPYSHMIDVQLLNAIGENLVDIVLGEKQALEVGMKNNMLSHWYEQSLGMRQHTTYLTQLMKQIAHRYPQMNILEIGASTGGITEALLNEVGNKISSYSYTDISSGFFETAQRAFSKYLDRMKFKVLDISKDPRSQGYAEHSYDVVVASMALHGTPILEDTLQNVRRLLKPGGFLVALELQVENPAHIGSILGAFPDWWLGATEGRILSPCIDLAEWEERLRSTGFSGCDTATSAWNTLVMPQTVFVSQAVDDRIEFLRDPLSSVMELFNKGNTTQDLVLLGGGSLQTSRLVGQVKSLLSRFWIGDIKTVRSLAALSSLHISLSTTVLSLAELDGPVFKDLDNASWEALKTMFQEAKTVLWVTRGRRAENPYANMMVGLLRSAMKELPTLDIQLLDVEGTQEIEPRTLAEALLRLKAVNMWQQRDGPDSLLSTFEPELVREDNGQVVIPRLYSSREMNDRYNSLRRPIMAKVSSDTENIGISVSNDGICILQEPMPKGDPKYRVRITHSTLSSIQISRLGSMFVVLGQNLGTGDHVVALSTENNLVVCPRAALSLQTNIPDGAYADFVSLVTHHLLAKSILDDSSEGDTIVMHEIDTAFAAAMAIEARLLRVNTVFTTAKPSSDRSKFLHVHASAPDRALVALLPTNTSAFFDFSGEKHGGSLGNRISSHLPVHCTRQNSNTLFASSAWVHASTRSQDVQYRLENVVAQVLNRLEGPVGSSHTVALKTVSELPWSLTRQTVVDWDSVSDVSIAVRPITSGSQIQFSDSKTYLLAGLSGGLGLALCEWMVRHGAKYIAISSRNPQIDKSWLEQMLSVGAVIKTFACDILQKNAVIELYGKLTSTMPSIAGVCQGAMVLEDRPFREMSLETFLKTTKPKVQGSLHLNDLFQENTLDFFIFFSSATAIPGNFGQCNYTAANMFMTALAEQRRQRGLAASVMHIGAIFGVGYIAQQGITSQMESLSNLFTPLSEQDFFQHFAEAVLTGYAGSTSPLEIASGLKPSSISEAKPLMSHFMRKPDIVDMDSTTSKSQLPVKTQLMQARGRSQVSQIIQKAFILKLSVLFQADLDKLEKADLTKLRLDEMGIDSLLAVEIRSWFVKTLEVNIPVLKILSGVAVAELIEEATETIPPSLIPDIDAEAVEIVTEQNLEQSRPEAVQPDSQRLWLADEPQLPPKLDSEGAHEGAQSLWTKNMEDQQKDSVSSETPSFLGSETSVTARFTPIRSTDESTSPPDNDSESLLSFISCPPLEDETEENIQAAVVPKSALQKSVKMSFGQSLFWFASAFSQDPTSLNLTGMFRLTGKLRINDMEKAVKAVGQQHESLRTCFFEQNDQPMQGIMKNSPLQLECHQIREEHEVETRFKNLHGHLYNLAQGETVGLVLLSLSSTEHFFLVGAHHLAMDGFSFQVMMKDLLLHYNSRPQDIKTRQYAEFSEEQHADFEAGNFNDDLTFWKTELANLLPTLPILRLSTAISRPQLAMYGNAHVDIRISREIKKQIQSICRRCRSTPFHFYLAVFRVLLYRYSSASDFSIGIGDANRTEHDMMGSIGDFINVLPLQFCTEGSTQFEALLQETRSKTFDALAHSRVPFQVLLNKLGISRSPTTTPIFQAFIDYRLGQQEKTTWGNCELELMAFDRSKLAYDISLDIIDNADGDCLLTFVVRDDLYSQKDVERLAKSYEIMAKAFSSKSMTTLNEPNIFDPEEIEKALNLGRGPIFHARHWGKTVVHRIDEVAKEHPEKIAVIAEDDQTVTYRELSNRINILAAELLSENIVPGSSVAVLQESTPGWVASILAVMRVGATYLPLDLGTPLARLAVMVNDCQPEAVLVDKNSRQYVEKLQRPEMKVIEISALIGSAILQVPVAATADGVATILYTSGSSGTPKGIVLNHQGMKGWLEPCGMLYNMTDNVFLQQSSQGFDMSLMQILSALCFEGKVYLLPRRLRGDARAIAKAIIRQGVTNTIGTPSEYFSWLVYGEKEVLRTSAWRTALVGGEPCARPVLREFADLDKKDLGFHHIYGTTETTFCGSVMNLPYAHEASKYKKADSAHVNYPAGVVLPNYTFYVLDEHMKPLPAGLQGEIYIGGAGVAYGYLNNPSLTAEKFVPDVFTTPEDRALGWTTMQRTGDLGRWREDGAIFIEGRISGDTQVKLRGLRLDLREVENALINLSAGAISEAVVSVRLASPETPEFLVAHIVYHREFPETDRDQCLRRLRSELELPKYMHPAFIISIERMPVTGSGKLDRKAVGTLSLPEDTTNTEDVELTPTEERLKKTWTDVLSDGVARVHHITPETDFFHIGGTSLLLLALRDKIKSDFNLELSLIEFFEHSILSGLARKIDGASVNFEGIDWEEETALRDSMINSTKGPLQPVEYSDSKVVILTGGSGYMGKGFVNALIADPTVKEVHCLGVRNVAKRTELLGLEKVFLHEGDLKDPRIGMSQDTIDALFSRAHVIIHNGADISYLRTYQSLRQSNCMTTKDLVEWSFPRMIPFHFVSSAGIATFAPGTIFGASSAAAYPPPVDGSDGYPASKWASEQFLEKLVQQYPAWPVCVHRPSMISRDDVPQLDLGHSFLKYSRMLGAVPSTRDRTRGAINMVQLETCVKGILDCALSENVPAHRKLKGQVHFVHHLGELSLPFNDMPKWALDRNKDGYVDFAEIELKEIPLDEWLRRAGDKGMHPTIITFLKSFGAGNTVEFPTVTKDNYIKRLK